jgi:hypothetical protein
MKTVLQEAAAELAAFHTSEQKNQSSVKVEKAMTVAE